MTAPTRRAGGLDANARGIAVLAAAVLIGFLLLLKAGDTGSASSAEGTDPVPSTTVDTSGLGTEPGDTTTTPDEATSTTAAPEGAEARAPGEVQVVVLNADGPAGSARAASETIGAAGYQMGEPANANAGTTLEQTAVYFAEGYQAEANAVALVLGKAPDAVQPMPDPVPGPGADTANVVVVLGADTAPAGGDTTSTTTAGDAGGTDADTTTTTGG
ncbi:MAG TPA: LytR C-terminal domain-containing protein [Aquihabitans sp.]|nr:LytR C-terminal domain-containing protein [Aquihabitans sp.]